jgi:hypothetical protein
VDSANSGSDYFAYLCIPASETTLHQKEYQLRLDLTFDDRLKKPTAKMNPVSWIAPLQGVDYCFIWSKLQQLCCRFCTRF